MGLEFYVRTSIWTSDLESSASVQTFMAEGSDFQTYPIICLEHHRAYLYAELIQVVQDRQLCWARPLALAIAPVDQLNPIESAAWLQQVSDDGLDQPASDCSGLYDLRQGADLLWPQSLFRPALDTEVIPLLCQLGAAKAQLETDKLAHQQLRAFIQKVWQAHPDVFQAKA